jgi:hypothetical protein
VVKNQRAVRGVENVEKCVSIVVRWNVKGNGGVRVIVTNVVDGLAESQLAL